MAPEYHSLRIDAETWTAAEEMAEHVERITGVSATPTRTGKSFDDFYRAHGACPDCAGRGIITDYANSAYNAICITCKGKRQ